MPYIQIRELFTTHMHALHIAFLLIATIIFGSVAIGYFIQKNPLIRMFDVTVYNAIHHGPHSKIFDSIVNPFNFGSIPLPVIDKWPTYMSFMVLVMFIYLYLYRRALFFWAFFTVLLASMLAYIVAIIDWHFVHRDRPFLTLPNIVDEFSKSVWKDWSSFPSGHARETTLYNTIIAAYIPRLRWVMFFFVLFITWSRLYLGAHYLTDVLAGMLIGYLTAKVSLIVAREVQIILNKQKGGVHSDKPKTNSGDRKKGEAYL